METKRNMKFTVEKGSKRPTKINKNGPAFALNMPERLKIRLGETQKFLMNFNVYLPGGIFAVIVLLPFLQNENLILRDYQYTSDNTRKAALELFNKNLTKTFDLKKDKKLLA